MRRLHCFLHLLRKGCSRVLRDRRRIRDSRFFQMQKVFDISLRSPYQAVVQAPDQEPLRPGTAGNAQDDRLMDRGIPDHAVFSDFFPAGFKLGLDQAYHLRAPGQKGIHISAWGSFLGQLLLRSMDRAQELYSSMQLRGYRQQFHYADVRTFRPRDALYIAGCVVVFIFLRYFRLAQFLGSIVVR